jgi:hypothetical protein
MRGGSIADSLVAADVGLGSGTPWRYLMSRSSSPSSTQWSAAKREAQHLLKQLRGADPAASTAAAERFRALRSFAHLSTSQLLEIREQVRLKHALAVVALARGYDSWIALKAGGGAPAEFGGGEQDLDPGTHLYGPRLAFLLNKWFATYEGARAALDSEGGFLLPYGEHVFITEADGVRELGLDPEDPDWERIGRDWIRPADAEAHRRLLARWRKAVAAVEKPRIG